MKIEKRHLNLALVILLLAVAWNVSRFLGPATPRVEDLRPILQGVQPPERAGSVNAVDPTTIPVAPAVAMEPAPTWPRDPFLATGESRRPRVPLAPVPMVSGPEPVVRSILYSAGRKVALVDHRVVGVGDALGDGVVTDIQPDAIVIRTPSGQTRRVAISRKSLTR